MIDKFERTHVIILTRTYRIEGKISLIPTARVTDFILEEGDFIVVTDAGVMDKEGNLIFTTKVLNINRRNIELITPADGVSFR